MFQAGGGGFPKSKDKSPSSNVKRNSHQSESDWGRVPLHIWILGWLALAFLVLTFSSIRTLGQHQPLLHLAWACLCPWLVFVMGFFFQAGGSASQNQKIPHPGIKSVDRAHKNHSYKIVCEPSCSIFEIEWRDQLSRIISNFGTNFRDLFCALSVSLTSEQLRQLF